IAPTAEGKTSILPHWRAWTSGGVVFEAMGKPMVQFPSANPRNDAASFFPKLPIGRCLMAKRCAICGKEPQYGHHVSHAKNRVNRRFMPNLQMGRVTVAGRSVRARVCTRCLRPYSAPA